MTTTWADFYQKQSSVCNALVPKRGEYRSLIKMILFEVVHEDAVPWDWDGIWRDILLENGNCFPYEHSLDGNEGHRRQTVKYYAKSAPMLATFYNKMRHEFFERKTAQNMIVKPKFRTLGHIVKAVLQILTVIKPHVLGHAMPTNIEIEALILNQQYCEAKHTQHKLDLVHDTSFEEARVRHLNGHKH